jgi:hypothetical protein
MSEEETPIPDATANPVKGRKSSSAKSAKPAKSSKSKDAAKIPVSEDIIPDLKPVTQEADWPEPEKPSSGTPQDRPKKKRRRKKGKGGQSPTPPSDDVPSTTKDSPSDPSPPRPSQSSKSHERSSIDPQLLAKRAWRIFLAEVSEEGVALIGDNDAKDLARRCFRLAEIFIEEQSRHR